MALGLRDALFRVLAITLSTGAVLLVLEIGFRILDDDSRNAGRLENLEAYEAQQKPGNHSYAIRMSENPRIIYELKPNLSYLDKYGEQHSTNEAGFRGPLVSLEKPPGTIRIVGLGDSVMYGNGVSDGENFLSLLSVDLNREFPENNWEIVNTAVGGYNTRMEVETLKDKGLAYDPEIVIIMFVGNDVSLPNFIRDRHEPVSYLWDFVKSRAGGVSHRGEQLVPAPKEEGRTWFVRNPDDVPAKYRDMVGDEGYVRAMTELADLRDQHGFELILVVKNATRLVRDTCEKLGIPWLSFRPAIQQYSDEHGIKGWRGTVLSVSEDDPHPSAVGHRLYADTLLTYLADTGVLARAQGRLTRE